MARLERTLGLAGLVFYGVGMIVGAGVYSVIGAAAGQAGDAMWMAFLLGAVVALLTGLSYAELATMLPRAGAEYVYVRRSFPRWRGASVVVGLVLVCAAAATAGTVAIAFAGYLAALVPIPKAVSALALLAVLSVVNVAGLRTSTVVNVVFTLLEVAGLVAFVALGATSPTFGDAFAAAPSAGVLTAAALLFFAFLGFEDIVNLAEEAKHPTRDLPRAILVSLAITSVVYVAVGLAAVALASPSELAGSDAPLVSAARSRSATVAGALGGVALFATANTALIALVAGSRMLFGIARDGELPALFARVLPSRRTPWVAAIVLAALAASLVPLGSVAAVAELSSFAALVAFAGVNVSLVVLRYRAPTKPRPFRVPLAVGRFPVLPALALLLAGGLLTQLGRDTWIGGGIALAAATLLWVLSPGRRRRRAARAASSVR